MASVKNLFKKICARKALNITRTALTFNRFHCVFFVIPFIQSHQSPTLYAFIVGGFENTSPTRAEGPAAALLSWALKVFPAYSRQSPLGNPALHCNTKRI